MSQIRSALQKSIGASWTLAYNTTNSLKGLYGKDIIDLGYVISISPSSPSMLIHGRAMRCTCSDLSRHGVVEHDASVIRK